ncbi:MAG: GAF domain-containing protein [Planctomycetota bacterium]|nr:MAG: GAF domain-containing protein [Planctomycetota bacterium]REK39337.1 MAG: GAF domain-containing protein [Planctomycetota bacterium]
MGETSPNVDQPDPGCELLLLAAQQATETEFLARGLSQIRDTLAADTVTLAAADRGRWTQVAQAGAEAPLPTELLAEVLDAHVPQAEGDWLAAPVDAPNPPPVDAPGAAEGAATAQEVLAVRGSDASLEEFARRAATLATALACVRARQHDRRRLHRLETILTITSAWNQERQMEPLLVKMAEAATKLLVADRASIFLWDKPNKTLVGRPALGVEGGELRIGDEVGVVGEVVQTGEPRRVDPQHDAESIDRAVDKQTGYQTDSLVCVPLRAADGEILGAFEVINKLDGDAEGRREGQAPVGFSREDQQALTELAAHAATALANTQELEDLVARHQVVVDEAAAEVNMIGHSPAIEALRSTIDRIADTDLAVLILGENGTGKEIVARMIHYHSSRRNEPLVAVNCAAIPDTLLESELFGHEKGAFTDAAETRIGKFELAAAGTLFLDEIGDMSLGGQSKLLRVLEEKTVVRVGGSMPIHTEARVIAATNQSLAKMVANKSFRQDLYFRLNVVTLELPPLRDRGDDIVLLAEHFLGEFARAAGRRRLKFSAAARKALVAHSWPGNIRELRNMMERLAYLTSGERIDEEDVKENTLGARTGGSSVPDDLPLAEATTRFQQHYIERSIARSRGNMRAAADRLGLHRSNLYRKMRQLEMQADEEEEDY